MLDGTRAGGGQPRDRSPLLCVHQACHCVFGNWGNCTGDYGWTEATLPPFLEWVASKGIAHIAVWRADIYPLYCKPSGVEPWMLTELRTFLAGGADESADESGRVRAVTSV